MVKYNALEVLGGKLGWTLPGLKGLQDLLTRHDAQQMIKEKASPAGLPAHCEVLTAWQPALGA